MVVTVTVVTVTMGTATVVTVTVTVTRRSNVRIFRGLATSLPGPMEAAPALLVDASATVPV